jgi:hypothetical protein
MMVEAAILLLIHRIGLVLAVGGATVKLVLLLNCFRDLSFVAPFLKVSRLITRQILAGLVLLTASGLAWVSLGHPVTSRLLLKLAFVAAIWVMGPVIDNRIEPRFRALLPVSGRPPSPSFLQARRHYLGWELVATLLFYVIVVIWTIR